MLSREPEPDIASGAVCCGCTRRLDMYTDDLWWLGDGPSVFPLGPSGLRSLRAPRATRALGGHRGRTCVYLSSTVRWIHIMKPVPPHSAECGECGGPPGQPARTRGRPQRYTQARNRECPGVTDLAVVSGQFGVKLAYAPMRLRALLVVYIVPYIIYYILLYAVAPVQRPTIFISSSI